MAASAAVLLAFLMGGYFTSEDTDQIAYKQDIKEGRDTVYVDKVITETRVVPAKTDTIVKYVKVPMPSPSPPMSSTPPEVNKVRIDQFPEEVSDELTLLDKRKGRSVKEDKVAQMILGMGY